MTYDFETIRAKLTGVATNENTRRHRLFATSEQVQSELAKYKCGAVRYRSFGLAESDLLNAKLLEIAPLTPRQKAQMSRNKQLKFRPRVQITLLGTLYLQWCEQPRALVVAGHWHRLSALPKPRKEHAPMMPFMEALKRALNTGASVVIDRDIKHHPRLRINGNRVYVGTMITANEIRATVKALQGDYSAINRNTHPTIKLDLGLTQPQGPVPFVTVGKVSAI